MGFTSDDGVWVRCSREQKAGILPPEDSEVGTVYRHRIGAACRCGTFHGAIPILVPLTSGTTGHAGREHPEAKGWAYRHPVPDGAPPRPWEHPGARRPEAVYPWTDAQGRVVFYTLRFVWEEHGRRRKAVTPRTVWERPDGSLTWEKAGPPAGWRRPLLNLAAIASHPGEPLLVVEGEKSAHAAASRAPGHIVTTWHGGSGAVHLTDWRPVAGHPVTIWPDADHQGAKAAAAVARACREAGAVSIRIVKLPPGLPSGWDLADRWPAGMEGTPWMA